MGEMGSTMVGVLTPLRLERAPPAIKGGMGERDEGEGRGEKGLEKGSGGDGG